MESNMKTVQISKISAGSVYKLIAIGLTVGFLPLFIIFGIMGAFGMEGLTWNGESVTGLKALFIFTVNYDLVDISEYRQYIG